ncbi:hypothetical protein FGF1_03550 [Flavobacteriaceae bacterium GF1]
MNPFKKFVDRLIRWSPWSPLVAGVLFLVISYLEAYMEAENLNMDSLLAYDFDDGRHPGYYLYRTQVLEDDFLLVKEEFLEANYRADTSSIKTKVNEHGYIVPVDTFKIKNVGFSKKFDVYMKVNFLFNIEDLRVTPSIVNERFKESVNLILNDSIRRSRLRAYGKAINKQEVDDLEFERQLAEHLILVRAFGDGYLYSEDFSPEFTKEDPAFHRLVNIRTLSLARDFAHRVVPSTSYILDTKLKYYITPDYNKVLLLLILSVIFSVLWSQSSNIGFGTRKKGGLKTQYQDSLPKIFLPGLEKSYSRSVELYSRSTLMLVSGILMSVVGIIVFAFFLPDPENFTVDQFEKYLMYSIRPTMMLIFIESVAFYLLKQYRILIEDYKYFNNIYLDRLNNAEAYILQNEDKNKKHSDLIAKLLKSETNRKLVSGESTEHIETMKNSMEHNDPMKVLESMYAKIGSILNKGT